jgi:hypothetical protein
MKMKSKVSVTLEEIATTKVNGMNIPQTMSDYIRIRMRAKERVLIEAQDTAHMHGAWVFDHATLENTCDVIDELGWIILYEEIAKVHKGIPLSFLRALSFSISPDKMEKQIKCEFDPVVLDAAANMVAILFDGAKLGLWEMDDAKKFSIENYPEIPIFEEAQWKEAIIHSMGGMKTDMEDLEVPQGGLDVFLL